MRFVIPFSIAAGIACAVPNLLPAQETGGGFWAGITVGAGRQRSTCDICAGDGNGGWTLRLAAGGTRSPKLRLGGELQAWSDRTEELDSRFVLIAPTAYWRPSSKVPYFLMAGVGVASFRVADSTEALTSTSIGVTIGGGYELSVADHWAITAYAGFSGSLFANLTLDRTNIANVRHTLLQIGIGVMRK